ncbi:MAG: S41 family peptidase [Lagierella massiliensis]|nr:S41 family peptidase [Lagierella massiliensis]
MNRKRFMIVIVITFLIMLFAIFLPYTKKEDKSSEKKETYILTKDESLEEFDFISQAIEKNYVNYPYIANSGSIDFNKLKEIYTAKLEHNLSLPEYKFIIKSYLKEFSDENLDILEYPDFLNLYNIYSTSNDSPIHEIVTNQDVLKVYKEFKNSEGEETDKNSNLILDNQGDNVAIIRIDDFNQRFKIEDGKKIKQFLQKVESYPYLIIDIREGHGDSLDYAVENLINPLSKNINVTSFNLLQRTSDFQNLLNSLNIISGIKVEEQFKDTKNFVKLKKAHQIEQFPLFQTYTFRHDGNNDYNFKGKIYVIQSQNTKGAADFLSQITNRTSFGVTVGTFTSGNGISPIDAFIKLPNSHLIISLPYSTGVNEDGYLNSLNGTYPEIPVDENVDSLDYILNYLNQ